MRNKVPESIVVASRLCCAPSSRRHQVGEHLADRETQSRAAAGVLLTALPRANGSKICSISCGQCPAPCLRSRTPPSRGIAHSEHDLPDARELDGVAQHVA